MTLPLALGAAVPLTNVTVLYENSGVADAKLTDAAGGARFARVMEKMVNATGEYYVGNYTVEATYAACSGFDTVNITENRQITLKLADSISPSSESCSFSPLYGYNTTGCRDLRKKAFQATSLIYQARLGRGQVESISGDSAPAEGASSQSQHHHEIDRSPCDHIPKSCAGVSVLEDSSTNLL